MSVAVPKKKRKKRPRPPSETLCQVCGVLVERGTKDCMHIECRQAHVGSNGRWGRDIAYSPGAAFLCPSCREGLYQWFDDRNKLNVPEGASVFIDGQKKAEDPHAGHAGGKGAAPRS